MVLAVLVLLDCTTTYFASYKYPLEYEFNVFIRELMRLQRELVFVYAVIEYLVLICYCKMILPVLKAKLKVKYKIEYLVLAVLGFVVVNNIVSLLV
jgi:hypothetical protein